ncbi:MAG: TraR/DksA family transcriptional regulator [candidate division Zixibacteria bacterium]|nr:TraR/DksA family transcriptional regulator [candidate division Zixibacteria bacterium]
MRARELKRYEKLLLERRAAIFQEIERMSADARKATQREASGELSSHTFHMADRGTDQSEREKVFMLSSKGKRYLYHIDEALRRIKDKTYGKCHKCGKNISAERLKAVPHARFCIECKEAEENAKR